MLDLVDRTYVSRFGAATFGIEVHRGAALAAADNNEVTATLSTPAGTPVFTRTATSTALGLYSVALSSVDTVTPGNYSLTFSYSIDTEPSVYAFDIEVGNTSPAYDALSDGWKDVVENVWVRFSDLFDSAYGGPHLQTYLQSHFGRNRLAQLLRQAVGRLNTIAQPNSTYSVGGDFPFAQWAPLVESALYVEVVKHLIRSYVEQPEVVLGTSISRTDRRDYMQRWKEVLDMETEDLQRALGLFKMSQMNLGGVSVLLSGGAFGNFGPSTNAGSGEAAARGYYFVSRFHG